MKKREKERERERINWLLSSALSICKRLSLALKRLGF